MNASVRGVVNMMPSRRVIRSLLSLTVFFGFFVSVLSELDFRDVKDDDRLPWEFYALGDDELRSQEVGQLPFADVKPGFKSPQQRYLEEMKKVSSQFKSFISTTERIQAPESPYDNPQVWGDPRATRQQRRRAKAQKIYRPYPDYESDAWKQTHRGAFVPCVGPRGKLLNESLDDSVGVYAGIPKDFPQPIFGSYDAIGTNGGLSYDRYSRYGAYGFGEDETSTDWIRPAKVEWSRVNWGALQRDCVQRNANRFNMTGGDSRLSPWPSTRPNSDIAAESRTAILLRSYADKVYYENDKQVIRSMVTELALQSGGEYEVFLLVHVKDDDIPIHENESYEQVLRDHVPEEFWNITILWNMGMVSEKYTKLHPSVLNVYQSQWLPIQHFVLEHPEFDHVWNWEMDTRYTGHLYELTEKIAEFGRTQPRREIWERSERFYIPSIHGDYDSEFRDFVAKKVGQGVWGHISYDRSESTHMEPEGPIPPVATPSLDEYKWGVGEEADFIGFLPIFNPINTDWVLRDDVMGYLGPDTPRRATIITHSRMSKRLLLTMDEENRLGRHIGSEMNPQTVALLHGYKSVFAPHPIWSDKPLGPRRVDRWFNSGINGRSGSSRDSPFSWGREQRFQDLSWYYRCNLPGRLYWNFLGWEKDSTGGTNYERRHGRIVLPAMLFHPIKNVYPDSDSMDYEFPT